MVLDRVGQGDQAIHYSQSMLAFCEEDKGHLVNGSFFCRGESKDDLGLESQTTPMRWIKSCKLQAIG